MKPRLFIGSSKESVNIAYAVQQNLRDDAEATVWDQGVFKLSKSALESIIEILDNEDFGAFVFSPDDVVTIRKSQSQSVRDNIIFELGLFVGHLGRNRCFILAPDKSADLRIPTDLIGMTPATYETGRSDGSFQAATGPACHTIRETMKRIGPRVSKPESPNVIPRPPKPMVKGQDFEAEETTSSEEASSGTVKEEYDWLYAFIDKEYEKSLSLLKAKISREADADKLAFLESWAASVEYNRDPKVGDKSFEVVFSKYETSYHPYVRLAYEYIERNLHPQGLSILETGLQKVTNKSPLIRMKAQCLRDMGREGDVVATLREGTTKYPDDSENYISLADYYIDRKEYPTARSCLEEGLSVIPNNQSLLSSYAKLLYDHIDKKLALIPYNQLVSLFPNNHDYLCLRANIYLDLELNDLTMRDYKRASELAESKKAWIIANIGNLQKNQGFYREAIETLQCALSIEPESQYALDRLAGSIKLRDEQVDKLSNIIKEAKREILTLRGTTGAEEPSPS